MPWLQRIGKGYRVAWRDGGRGAPIRTGQVWPTKADAAEHLRAMQREALLSRPVQRGVRLSLADVLERWLHSRRRDRNASDAYLAKARATLGRLIEAKGWQVPSDITADSLGGAGIGALRLVRALLRYADSLDQPIDRRALRVRPPPTVRRPEPELLSDDEVQALIDRAGEWGRPHEALAHLIATYGHRPHSLAALVVGDLDLAAGTLTLRVKAVGGRREWRHPLLPQTLALLRPVAQGRPDDAPLLISHLGGRWRDGQAIAQWWYDSVGAEVLGRADRRCGVYQLKAYAISRMQRLGLDLRTIASITGHSSIQALSRYLRTSEERQRHALATLGREMRRTP
jgi:site-specific recombinase XerD